MTTPELAVVRLQYRKLWDLWDEYTDFSFEERLAVWCDPPTEEFLLVHAAVTDAVQYINDNKGTGESKRAKRRQAKVIADLRHVEAAMINEKNYMLQSAIRELKRNRMQSVWRIITAWLRSFLPFD